MMDFLKNYITRHLAAIILLLVCTSFIACFDIPSKPNTKESIKDVTVQIMQNGKIDSLLLKIHPKDSAILSAIIHPKKYANELKFLWYHKSEDLSKDSIGEGQNFIIYAGTPKQSLPNMLIITDKEKNSLTKEFEIIINSPPTLGSTTQPTKGDTLYGSKSMAFEFAWFSSDKDNEVLKNSIIIDDVVYNVGNLTRIYQSGFKEGKHSYQIYVSDDYGDMDSTSIIYFYVKESQKGEK